LSNALKVSPTGSAIRVRVAKDEYHARLAVIDEGPGIPQEEREAVFEPFHRVRGGPPGTGLGLSIVRDVALRHGGRAWIEPTTRGTEVIVAVPLSA
jgi:signal transduction histidine kinase